MIRSRFDKIAREAGAVKAANIRVPAKQSRSPFFRGYAVDPRPAVAFRHYFNKAGGEVGYYCPMLGEFANWVPFDSPRVWGQQARLELTDWEKL